MYSFGICFLLLLCSRKSGTILPTSGVTTSVTFVTDFTFVTGERGGSVSDSGARGRGFDTYRRRVVSLSKTLYSPKVLVNDPGSGGSVPT